MKVLHVVPSLLPESGGPSRVVPELCRALAAAGTQVTLFSTHLPGQGLTIDQKREPYESVLFPAEDGSLAGARQIHAAIKRRSGDFDLIHITSLWNLTATGAAAAARRVKKPYIIAPMGMLSDTCLRQKHYRLKRAYSWIYDRRTVEGAARLHLANADELRSLRSTWLRYPKHFFAHNGTSVPDSEDQKDAFRRMFPELGDRRLMIFMGRLHPIKGLALQFRAFELLAKKFPDLIWVLIGPDEGEWLRLHELIREAGLKSRVKWIGFLPGEERFSGLANAAVVVQTSLYECQSMTVNEALAVGVPLVVTDSVNYSEVQTAGAGYVVRSNPEELATAIESVLQDQEKSDKMRVAGRRFASQELSWATIATNLNASYREVISESRRLVQINEANAGETLFTG